MTWKTRQPVLWMIAPVPTWLSRTDTYSAFLMFQPYSASSIPVPMYAVNWAWSGVARTNGSPNNYSLITGTPGSPTVSQTSTYPLWITNATSFNYVTNSTPFNEN